MHFDREHVLPCLNVERKYFIPHGVVRIRNLVRPLGVVFDVESDSGCVDESVTGDDQVASIDHVNRKNAPLHDGLLGEDGVAELRRLFQSLHFDQSLLDLGRSLHLVFDSEVEIFDFFLQELILFEECIDKFIDVDAFILALVHEGEDFGAQVVEVFALAQVRRSSSGSPCLGTGLLYHVLDQFFSVDVPVAVDVDCFKLALQLHVLLLVLTLFFNKIGAVDVNVVKVSSGRVWISH